MKFDTKWELTNIKEKIGKMKVYRYFIEKNRIGTEASVGQSGWKLTSIIHNIIIIYYNIA